MAPTTEAIRDVIELPDLHASQAIICQDPCRFKVLACGRRWGKTTLGIILCLTVALQGGRAWWVASTYDTAYEGWEPLKALAAEFPFAVIRESRRTIFIKIPGQPIGRIQVRSADRPAGLRGPGLDFVVLDEAAHCQEKAWTESLRPALADRQGRALLISTPNGKNWFHKLFERGQDRKQDAWRSWRKPTWDNPFIAGDEIDQAREDSHPDVFSQEFGAEFLDLAMVRPYKMEWLLDYDPAHIPPMSDLYICLGVDPAISKRDTACQTAITVAAQAIRGPLQSSALILDHIAGHWSPYETADHIFGLLRKYPGVRSVRIEDVAYQRALKDIVERESRDRGAPLPFIDLAKPELDKLRRALNVSPMVESGRVLFNPLLTALKKSLISIPEEKSAWDDADAFELAIQGLPVRGSQRTKLQRADTLTPTESRAQSYAVKAMQTVSLFRRGAALDPPMATYLGKGVWRPPAPTGPAGRRITTPGKRAASYATTSPLSRSRGLFGASFGGMG